ncbi:ferritin-like domain-containing protein [Erythrobacter crassostreae]|uniref:Ferritin-like domain-containing protein n=1 Tax=Erythrobacter crassostreae TaxID=2828328 RepID=A0A9X1JMH3_9SPHN|nr:ferritin-like domain-containing protein [Erythrobacter crassostrea]MBV7258728.1 ferritin-like domain-containing protein [Erythrobacter crassostrea]
MQSLSSAIHAALMTAEPRAKCFATRDVARRWRRGELSWQFDVTMPEYPARPDEPELLAPNKMPKRGKFGSERARIALWHSLAHIEFVAIDLALDMAGRFGEQMGDEFVSDFLYVAADEAMHFALLDRKLKSLGNHYGALPAHGGLWEAAHTTRHDVAARLAIVPMVLEARGLDVTPATLDRVRAAGDEHGARILARILDDEIRHVGFGTKHFMRFAETLGNPPESMWKTLVQRYFRGAVKPPFNDSARLAAGLSREFYADIAL